MESEDELCFIKEKYLQCPICMKTPPSTVFQCENGHMLCHQCVVKVRNTCPQCRVSLGEKKIPVLALEYILSEMLVNCPSRKFGCIQTINTNELKAHTKICEFRAVNICPNLGYNGCKTSVRSGVELIKHLQAAHFVILSNNQNLNKTHIILNNEEFSFNQPQSLVRYVVTMLNGKLEHFLIVVKVGPVSKGKSFHRCAVIYVTDTNADTIPKTEDFKAKIDIDIKQRQTKTHICFSTGSPLYFKQAEDAGVIPYFHTSMNYIKSRLDPEKGTSFELIATVEISYCSIKENVIRTSTSEHSQRRVMNKRSCDSSNVSDMSVAEQLRKKMKR